MTAPNRRSLVVHCTGPEDVVPDHGGGFSLKEREAHIWYTTLDVQEDRSGSFYALLNPMERERADRFRFESDRDRFVIANGLLRTLLAGYLDADPVALRIDRGPFGKPFLPGSALQFNLSDTKDAVIVACCSGLAVGADIETMTRTIDHMAVGEHYFTPDEIVSIQDSEDSKRRFLELWTRKEAVLKASGVGIMEDIRSLKVDAPLNTMTIGHAAFMEHAAEAYHVGTWHVGGSHLVSMACPDRPVSISFRQIPAN